MECVRWGTCALWLPASPVSCPGAGAAGLVWHLCSPFKCSRSLVNRHNIRRALWPPRLLAPPVGEAGGEALSPPQAA